MIPSKTIWTASWMVAPGRSVQNVSSDDFFLGHGVLLFEQLITARRHFTPRSGVEKLGNTSEPYPLPRVSRLLPQVVAERKKGQA